MYNVNDILSRVKKSFFKAVLSTASWAFNESYKGFIAFNPNRIKSVYNRGTFDPNNDNIYYQGQIADRVKKIFQPAFSDVEKFAETLKKAIRGELKPQTMLQVSSSTPEVYKSLGVEDKALNLPQNVLRKINIGKHNVPLSVIENLPEFIANPLVVLDSKTEAGSFISVLDATDANGDTVVAVIKPTDRNYNVIPSVYGKKETENLIKSSNVRYVNDIEKPATASTDLSSLQLRGGDSARGNSNNILQKSDIVNANYQNDKAPKGAYMKNLDYNGIIYLRQVGQLMSKISSTARCTRVASAAEDSL